MPKLRMTMACWNYDRTRALMDGRVPIEGVELNYLNLVVEETFFRMMRHQEFDVAEMSLASYTLSLFRDPAPFIAIPIYPSRSFRHSGIFVNADAGIREPRDLIGKRVGNPEYQLTANVWIRGILNDEYGVSADSVSYFRGGLEQPGRIEKAALTLPAGIRIQDIPEDRLSRKCWRLAKSTPFIRLASLHALQQSGQKCGVCSRTTPRSNATTIAKPKSSPSCTWLRSAAKCTRRIAGWRNRY